MDVPASAEGLLDYLARVLEPRVLRRSGWFRRGSVRYVELETPEALFIGRYRSGRLTLLPDVEPSEWAHRVVSVFTHAAAGDGELRRRISRAGWSLG